MALEVEDVNLAARCHHVLVEMVVALAAFPLAFGVATAKAHAFPDTRIKQNSFPNWPETTPPIPQIHPRELLDGRTHAEIVNGAESAGSLAQLKN